MHKSHMHPNHFKTVETIVFLTVEKVFVTPNLVTNGNIRHVVFKRTWTILWYRRGDTICNMSIYSCEKCLAWSWKLYYVLVSPFNSEFQSGGLVTNKKETIININWSCPKSFNYVFVDKCKELLTGQTTVYREYSIVM